MSFIQGYDSETLRERVNPAECADRLAEIESQRSLPALMERVWLLKVLDRLDEALTLSEEAVRVARMAGTRKDVLRARVLHATILQYRGAHAAAEQELATCATEAEGHGWSPIAAFAMQHHGKNAYDAGDFEQARESLTKALFLRRKAGADDGELEPLLLAIDAAERRRSVPLVAS